MEKITYEWRLTDSQTKQEIYDYFNENIDDFGESSLSVGWDSGVYSLDGTLFLTQHSSVNNCWMNTGDRGYDSGFQIRCLLFLKVGEDKWLRDTISYTVKDDGDKKDINVWLSNTTDPYRDRITEAVYAYENKEENFQDPRTKEEREKDREIIGRYISDLKANYECYRKKKYKK